MNRSIAGLVAWAALAAAAAAQEEPASELQPFALEVTVSAKQLALNDVYGRLVLLLDSLAVPQADGWPVREKGLLPGSLILPVSRCRL